MKCAIAVIAFVPPRTIYKEKTEIPSEISVFVISFNFGSDYVDEVYSDQMSVDTEMI